jgi:hypothetical protein
MRGPTLLIAVAVLALAAMPAYSDVARIHPDIVADTTTGNSVVTHMAVGGGWSTVVVLMNLGTTTANYTLRFYGDSGSPQAFSFKSAGQSLGTQSVLTGAIPVGGLVPLKAQDSANTTTTGWALIDPSSTGDIGGFAIFTYLSGQQAVVPIETSSAQQFVILFDNSGKTASATGIALANPHPNAVTVNVVFRDMNGVTLTSDQFQMGPMEHTSFVLATRYPSLAGTYGTALFSTDGSADAVAGLGILANSAGAYTTTFALTAQ